MKVFKKKDWLKYVSTRRKKGFSWKNAALFSFAFFFFASGAVLLWGMTLTIPDLSTFDERKISQSTTIYDKTGEIILYNVHENVKRTIVGSDEIPDVLKQAVIAIEDERFYQHRGIDPKAIFRMIFVNLGAFEYVQGGSTITQQAVKLTFLTREQTITRKLKEWILALKIEQKYSKEKILELYFNEVPYGGSVYGIEEAALGFFGKHASDLSLPESAYLAAIPNAPTYYSPHGNNVDKLEARKNLVLSQMEKNGFITKEEGALARAEKVEFLALQEETGIKAPHFVMYVREYLENKYGKDMLEQGGLRVVTTLDYGLQEKAEEVIERVGAENLTKFNANNAAAVGIDPKTGQILLMVGSRDYFDEDIDGNFNVAISPNRQPGSSFKPFVYATAFMKGYTPETVVFDVETEFNTNCTPDGFPGSPGTKPEECYRPENYDNTYRGPVTLRNALAQSLNIPAVKTFYLAGIKDSLETASRMGLSTLGTAAQYGLTLVLGSGEVSLLEMTGAYAVFANEGVKNPHTAILRIEDRDGNILEEFEENPSQAVPSHVSWQISSILSDNAARTPAFGAASALHFPGRSVAVKTGTSNDYRDAWILGYTPFVAIGAWVGNTDNSPMEKKVAGFIVAPLWHEIMEEAVKENADEPFPLPIPEENPDSLPPVLRGIWQNGPIHEILHWVDKANPRGGPPQNPTSDPQYYLWETSVRRWVEGSGITEGVFTAELTGVGDNHASGANTAPEISILSPSRDVSYGFTEIIPVRIQSIGKNSLAQVEYYVNGTHVGTSKIPPFSFSFVPQGVGGLSSQNELRVVGHDSEGNKGVGVTSFRLRQ